MDPTEFEEEVRAVCRALWPQAQGDGVTNLELVEHDGVFFTRDIVHCVEVTIQRDEKKAKHDGKKLALAIKKWTGSDGRLARGWFITLDSPTPHQTRAIAAIDKRIVCKSFRQFKAQLFDFIGYNQRRMELPFGSARNPQLEDGLDPRLQLEKYIPVPLTTLERDTSTASTATLGVQDVADLVSSGKAIALLADYGAGKSMTLRELYLSLAERHRKDESLRAPVHLNLREHWGQHSPTAALVQHAEELGFAQPEQLIAAWRAGFVHVLLDGFDELASPGWSQDKERMEQARYKAVKLVRAFVDQTPTRAGVVVAGRHYYFETDAELKRSLFGGKTHAAVRLNDFDDSQIRKYLERKKWLALPYWIPARPLLIGLLRAHGFFDNKPSDEAGHKTVGEGWDWLLDRICDRESQIIGELDGLAIRQIMERASTIARSGKIGLGPLTPTQLIEVFVRVRGQEPSDAERVILDRLPGLRREPDAEAGTRSFVDADLAGAAQARAISDYVANPHARPLEDMSNWDTSIVQTGIEVTAHQCETMLTGGQLRKALSAANKRAADVLVADLLRVALALDEDIGGERLNVSGVHITEFALDESRKMANVTISDSLIEELSLSGEELGPSMSTFTACHIEAVLGRSGETDLPAGKFLSCSFGDFPERLDRNASVMDSSLPSGVRVLITILRKLYMQRGRGRAESALLRGMGQVEQQYVPLCLDLINENGLATAVKLNGTKVWLPDRSSQQRVVKFVGAPRGGGDPLYALAVKL